MKFSRSVYVKVAAVALALAAAGTASVAQARSDVHFSIGAHVAPGVTVGVSNAPAYYPPVFVHPQPVYVHPAPVYSSPYGFVRPAPIYYAPPPVYYGSRSHFNGHRHGKHWRHSAHRGHGHGHGHHRR